MNREREGERLCFNKLGREEGVGPWEHGEVGEKSNEIKCL